MPKLSESDSFHVPREDDFGYLSASESTNLDPAPPPTFLWSVIIMKGGFFQSVSIDHFLIDEAVFENVSYDEVDYDVKKGVKRLPYW
jgi:hypothetical protein